MRNFLSVRIHGFPRKAIHEIFNNSKLWNRLLTYKLYKQLEIRKEHKDRPTPNSATIFQTLQIYEQNPTDLFSGFTEEELTIVKHLNEIDYKDMLQAVTNEILREKGIAK